MNNTALAIIQPQELDTIQRAAKLLAVSNYFDGKGDNPQAIAMIATKIMAGREMGFGPFASVNGVHIIQGKPSIGANLMASAVKSSGRYTYRVKVMNNDLCSLEFFERNGDKWESIGVSDFSRADATAAGTQNMAKFARNMLFARAMSNGVRWFCPDIFSGNAVYVPEELGATVDGDGNIVDSTYTVTPQEAPGRAQPADAVDSTSDTENAPQRAPVPASEGDVLFEKETPPHQRMFAQGFRVFGDAWNNGGRKWMLRKWSAKATPDNVRESAADLSDTEKDQLADYMTTNAATLKNIWAKWQQSKAAADVQSTGQPEKATA